MTEPIVFLDPTSERAAAARVRKAPPATLAGLRVGLLDISKPRGDVFLDHLEARLGAQGIAVERFRKPTFAKKMPEALAAAIAERCDIVVEALAD